MRTTKKFSRKIHLLLCVIVAVATLCVLSPKADAATSGYYTYTVADGKATITDCDQSITGAVVIPDTLGDAQVTKIADNAFYNCTGITSVTMGNSVTVIGGGAFNGCVSLKEVTLSKNLETLGGRAFGNTAIESIEIPESLDECYTNTSSTYSFNDKNYTIYGGPFYRCENLKEVTFEANVTQIPEYLFAGCTGLESVVIPNTVTTIESGAFQGSLRLSSVNIGSAVTKIDDAAFKTCVSLPVVDIPDSVTAIDTDAFNGCELLKKVTLSKNLLNLGGRAFGNTAIESIEIPKSLDMGYTYHNDTYSFNGEYYTIYGGPFCRCEDLKEVTFEANVTQIPEYLFAGCTGLESVVIPNTVTTIEIGAFLGCLRLNSVNIGSAVTKIDDAAFETCVSLLEVDIPDSVTAIDTDAFNGCELLKKVTLSKNLLNLGGRAFGNTAIESIEIPESLDECYTNASSTYSFNDKNYTIYGGPFCRCEDLKEVTFEANVTQIPEYLFAGCTGLESVVIPNTVTTIEIGAFLGCLRLNSVNIGSAVTKIDEDAFRTCVSLPTIALPNGLTEILDSAFKGCTALTSIEIPDSVNNMGTYCFDGCTALESVCLPSSRVNITGYSFRNCTALKIVELPASVQNIRSEAFYGCTSLESIVFPAASSLKLIESYAFYGCTSLKELILPQKVAEIRYNAFQNCTALEKAVLPQSLRTLGSQVFQGCEALSDVTFADYGLSSIPEKAFMDCPALQKIVLPKGLKTISAKAFMNCTKLFDVTIPESVATIDSTVFSYPSQTTIRGRSGSYAEIFANSGGFTFVDNAVPVEGLILKDFVEYVVLDQGDTFCAEFEYYPEDANDVITLTASNNCVSIFGHDIYGRAAGDTVITATATSGVDYVFTVHVRTPSKLSITTQPAKVDYVLGEAFDPSGMVVQLTYGDGSTREVTDYLLEGFDSSSEGSCTVKVKWTSLTGSIYSTNLTLNVIDTRPKATGISIASLPDKTVYALREKLDITGLVVNIDYTDGSAVETTDYTVSGYNALKKGTQTITVTCGEYTATFTVEVTIEQTYTVTFLDWDGTVVSKGTYVANAAVTAPADPTRASDETYSYTFAGWDQEITVCTGEATYTATYTAVYIEYTVTFVNDDGTVISQQTYHYGDTVSVPSDPRKEADADYTYTFTGWDKEIIEVAGDITYTATYAVTEKPSDKAGFVQENGIWYYYENGKIVKNAWRQDAHGSFYLTSSGALAVSSWIRSPQGWRYVGSNGYCVTSCWMADSYGLCWLDSSGYMAVNVWITENSATYYCDINGYRVTGEKWIDGARYLFDENGVLLDSYTVTFVDYDGTVLSCTTYYEGETVIPPTAPERAEDDLYTYTFAGWTPKVSTCIENVTYTATYSANGKAAKEIVSQPVSTAVDSGSTVLFSIGTKGEVLSYQWQYRKLYKWYDTAMEGYNTDTLTVTAAGSRNGYDYRCAVTFADGTVLYSNAAELTVKTYIKDVVCPNDQTVALGSKGQFTASAAGEGIRYQWQYQRPGSELWIDTTMDGCTKPTVMIETTASRNGYKYRCKITDVTGNEVYTESATMYVLSVVGHPQEAFTAPNTVTQFTVTASVTDGITYQWQYSKNGTTWINTTMTGYNTATLTVSTTLARNGYQYRCVLTGSKNSKIESKAALLHVSKPVEITVQPGNQAGAVGETVSFAVTATNAYAYQWQYARKGSDSWYNTSMTGATTETLSVEVTSGRNGYRYRCVVTGLDGNTYYTETATMTVG